MAMTIFLTGFMGCGKSTLGRRISSLLGWRFVDMDRVIEHEAGMRVSEIFDRHGEEYFRTLERRLLERLAGQDEDTVVSTGGGAPCREGNMEVMSGAGSVVYLKMSPEKLVSRLKYGREKRPKIKGMDDEALLAYIRETLPGREAYYNRAHIVIDCDGASDEYICRHIAGHIEAARQKK